VLKAPVINMGKTPASAPPRGPFWIFTSGPLYPAFRMILVLVVLLLIIVGLVAVRSFFDPTLLFVLVLATGFIMIGVAGYVALLTLRIRFRR
jgi:hypothetical protein